MSRLLLSGIAIFITAFISGCSTVKPAQHYGNIPLDSLKSAYVVVAIHGNPTIGGYIQTALARRNLKVNIGALKDKPQNVAFYVNYKEHWNWDVTVYLESLDIEFVDNANGQIIAKGSFRNSFLHTFPDPRTKTFEVVDSMFDAKSAK
jgi:hypothetical protein